MSTIQIIGNIVKSGASKLTYVKPSTVCETRQIPEYLYHFTSAKNAEEIIKSGQLIAHNDHGAQNIEGVFLLDFENFVKNWPKLSIKNEIGSFNFFNMLFCQATKGEERIACFRIPVFRLDKKMVIRDQKNLADASEKVNRGEDISSLVSKVDDADLYTIYHKNGHAVEFINPGDIKINREDLVGTAELPKGFMDCVTGREPKKSAFDTLKYLFIKQPEAKLLKEV